MFDTLERYAPVRSFNSFPQFVLTWTPRLVVAGVSGFYALGVAYEWGIMAAIDRIAIRILRHYVGYAGLGAAMPTFQWYAAWTVRAIAALSAGILYDLIERMIRSVWTTLHRPAAAPLHPTPKDHFGPSPVTTDRPSQPRVKRPIQFDPNK